MKRLFAVLLLLGIYACNDVSHKEGISITDDLGYSFVFDTIPTRVISLAPSITESIYFLNADSNLIGVTNYCDYPAQAKSKTIIGGMLDPNLEIITKLNPDLIFLTTEGNSQITYKSLKDLGFRVFVLNPKTIDGIVSSLNKLNSIFRKSAGEQKLIQFKKDLSSFKVDSLNKDFAGFLSINPLISFNKNTFINDIFKKSGFKNIYSEENLDYPGIAEEDLFNKNPEFLFVFAENDERKIKILKDEVETKFGKLKAVKKKKYYILDESVFSRPGPRVLESLMKLNSLK